MQRIATMAIAALILIGTSACAGNSKQLQSDLDACNAERASLTDQLAKTQAELDQERKKGEAFRMMLDRRIALDKALREKLKALTDAGKLTIKYRRGLLVLELPNSILFKSGSAELSEDGQATIKEVAGALADVNDRRLLVSGHTDAKSISDALKAKYPTNWELSFARARSVQKILLGNGVQPANTAAAGFAQYDPAADGEGEDVMKMNRRTEIVLVPNLEDVLSAEAPADETPES